MESGAVRAWPFQGSNTGRNVKVLPEDGVDPAGEKPVCQARHLTARARWWPIHPVGFLVLSWSRGAG